MLLVHEAVRKGVAFLESSQRPDGSFLTWLSSTECFDRPSSVKTTFAPALILASLARVPGSGRVCDKLASWLLQQKSTSWSFNYWPVNAPERKTRPYPDDLDDTFCALIALYRYNPALIDSRCLAKVVRLLIAAEIKVGGPYKTWLTLQGAPAHWQDVDIAVNANINYFMRLVSRDVPNVQRLLDAAVSQGIFTTQYYPQAALVQYYMARAGVERATLLKKITSSQGTSPAATALAITARNHAGEKPHPPMIEALLRTQRPDGSWPPEGLWIDRAGSRGAVYAGAPALTTAFVLEALCCNTPVVKLAAARSHPAPYKQVIALAKAQLQDVPRPLRTEALAMVDRMERGDQNTEIALLPHIFAGSLTTPIAQDGTFLAQLGAANLFGWMAYTIYDDFLDGEGRSNVLPVANVALRQSLQSFAIAVPDSVFQKEVTATFDSMDAANYQEVDRYRCQVLNGRLKLASLPYYKSVVSIADRSIGHTLTPSAVLTMAGIEIQDDRSRLVRKALRHYLAARQLNDDLHDWRVDVTQGHMSYVVAYMLRRMQVRPGNHRLQELCAAMERQLWRYDLTALCRQGMRQLAISKAALAKSGVVRPKSPLVGILDDLGAVFARTLLEQERAKIFLQAYASSD